MIWHLGSGKRKRPLGFPGDEPVLNIDIRDLPTTDVVADVRDLSAVVAEYGPPDKIAAEDVLEHLPRAEARKALAHWCDILKPDGELHLRVPDLDALARLYARNDLPFAEFERHVYGGQDYPENTHRCGFTPPVLRALLAEHGLKVTRDEIDPRGQDPTHTNMWIWADKPATSPSTPVQPALLPPVACGLLHNILITTPWTAQGLTTLSVHLGRTLRALGCTVHYHAWRGRFDPPGFHEDAHVIRREWGTFGLAEFDLVIWPEIVEAEQVKQAKAAGCKTAWVPMWEQIGHTFPDSAAPFDLIVCPTQACEGLARREFRGMDARLCLWWCDYPQSKPRPTPDVPVFFHCVRGISSDIRNTTALCAGWREFKASGGKGKLVIKTLAPLADVVSRAASANLPACEIIEGKLPTDDLLALYRQADAFVYPTKREGIGLVLLEALCAGLPLVTTGAPPMDEWVTPRNGVLIPPAAIRPHNRISEAVVHQAAVAAALRQMTRERIDELKRGTHHGLTERRERFVAFWQQVLSEVPRRAPAVPKPVPVPAPQNVPTPAPPAPTDNARCTICTVTYNRLAMTQRTVASVEAHTHTPTRWVFVDNGSTDGTVEWLQSRQWPLPVEVMPLATNEGKAAAMNAAMQRIDTPYWAMLDNDIEVPDGWLTACIDLLDAFPIIGVAGINLEPVDYPETTSTVGRRVCLKEVGTLGAGCVVLRRELIDLIGYHCTGYGLYSHMDADYFLRVMLSGLKQAYVAGMKGVHLGATGDDRQYVTAKHIQRQEARKLWEQRQALLSCRQIPLYVEADGK